MVSALQSEVKFVEFLRPFVATSDGKASSYVDYNGYNRALIVMQTGLQTAGDSDDTVSWQLYRVDDIAAASAAATDDVAITAGVVALTAPADSDSAFSSTLNFIDLDFVAHTLDNGCLKLIVTPSPGATVPCAATIALFSASGTHTDTSMTITTPASS